METLRQINQQRKAENLKLLHIHQSLCRAAREHAEDMAANDYFAHGAWVERIRRHYPNYRAIAENIAAGYDTVESVVAAWMASDGHRKNILSTWFQDCGIGYAQGGSYGHYWVIDFGSQYKDRQ